MRERNEEKEEEKEEVSSSEFLFFPLIHQINTSSWPGTRLAWVSLSQEENQHSPF